MEPVVATGGQTARMTRSREGRKQAKTLPSVTTGSRKERVVRGHVDTTSLLLRGVTASSLREELDSREPMGPVFLRR